MDEHQGTEASGGLRLHGWLDPPVVGVALIMAAAGFAQFSPAAALADVAEHFGDLRDGDTVAEQAGLPGTVLGTGLAAIRLSALVALPLAALADRLGRRRTMLTWATLGLLTVVVAAASPGYWWFVALFALARPLLTATDTIGEVTAAEHTSAGDRAKAIALMSAAYGFGAGAVAVLRAVLGSGLGFRGVFALSALPLALVWFAGRRVTEPARFGAGPALGVRRLPMLDALRPGRRGRLAALAGLAFATGLVTGPANTFLFVYAENVLDVSTVVTGALVVAAAPMGLAGLVLGRYLSDRFGRRPAAAGALVALCAAGVVTYAGSVGALVGGYLCGILVGAAYATPGIALSAELFPTSARASVAGWLVVAGVLGASSGLFLAGAIADSTDSFGAAMAWVCVPAALCALLVLLVPETRGLELEESAPELPSADGAQQDAATRSRQSRGPVGMVGVAVAVAIAGYAWWAVGLASFSVEASIAVLAAGGAAALVGARRRRTAPASRDARGLAVWGVVVAAGAALQLSAYLQHPRQDHPTLSSLANALLDSHPARAAAFVVWLAVTVELARR